MVQQALTSGLRNTLTPERVTICYPGKSAAVVARGDPVRVQLTSPFTLFWLERVPITLRASATMRLEQKPTNITEADRCPGT